MPFELDDAHVLITGATGFVGRHLTTALADTCAKTSVLVRSPEKAHARLPDSVQVHRGDMTAPSEWPDVIEEVDAIAHVANLLQGPPETMRAVNVEGTYHLARRAAAGAARRFLYVSSVMVYGFSAPPVVTEDTPYGTDIDAYAHSKQHAEALLLDLHARGALAPVIVEPSAIYGPYDSTWTLRPFQMAQAGQTLLPGHGIEQPIYISDLVDGMTAALQAGRPGERYILSGPTPVSLKQYFEYYTDMVGAAAPKVLPGRLMMAAAAALEWGAALVGRRPLLTRGEIRYLRRQSAYRSGKAATEFDFAPQVDLEEGMRHVRTWLRSEGHLE